MIGTSELILILIVALFLFGPTKLPELAHSLGKAMGEFKKAQMETEYDMKKSEIRTSDNNRDMKIHNLAIEMGINVENKSTEQLVEEIRARVRQKDNLKANTAGTI